MSRVAVAQQETVTADGNASVDTDFLDALAREFLAGTNDLLAPELDGPDVGLLTGDVQAQLNSLADPAAALQVRPPAG